jgi:ATP-dependent Clp protease ATP-binding subunit ClpC
VRDLLLREGYDEEYGARPLRRAIQTHVDDALADAVLAGTIVAGQAARLVVQDGKIAIEPQTVLQQAA